MALRNQPYIPLYVQDYLTDEKLNCAALNLKAFMSKSCVFYINKKNMELFC